MLTRNKSEGEHPYKIWKFSKVLGRSLVLDRENIRRVTYSCYDRPAETRVCGYDFAKNYTGYWDQKIVDACYQDLTSVEGFVIASIETRPYIEELPEMDYRIVCTDIRKWSPFIWNVPNTIEFY